MTSDLHYSSKPFYGQDQSSVFEWLYNVVEMEKPNLLVSSGDFGEEATLEMFQPPLKQTSILTIYGNHDNLQLIQNLRNYDNSYCWLPDGIVREWNEIRIVGINGNLAVRKRKPHHKTIDEVKELISRYSISTVDILVTHEAPKHQLLSKGERSLGFDVLTEALERLKPKLFLCGHIHIPSQIIQMNNTELLNLDSSTRHKEYATCIYENSQFKELQIKKLDIGFF